MTEPIDFWAAADFEDTVAAALIACFETKVKKLRGTPPPDRLTEERFAMMRSTGPYIPSTSRLIIGPDSVDDRWTFDMVNDKLPKVGCIAMTPGAKMAESLPNAYMQMFHVRQVETLGTNWFKRKAGTLYELLNATAESQSVCGERTYFTVTPTGEVWACNVELRDGSRSTFAGARTVGISHPEHYLKEIEAWASVSLQFLADRRHSWTITAKEQTAKAHLGCMQEEVKSLLYARSLPMTATGRKRPILHLVEAHKRRMANGTDIDVSSFLRGQQVVEIAGTTFTVNPPAFIAPVMSKSTRDKFFKDAA